jgi:hypothetical protein
MNTSTAWEEFKNSPGWKEVEAILKERIELIRNDLETGTDADGRPITPEKCRGGLEELRFVLALPGYIIEELKGEKDGTK